MTSRLILFGCICGLIFTSVVSAQETSPSPQLTSTNSANLDPAAATDAWLAKVPAEKRAKSDAYFEGGYWLILWNAILGAGIAIFLLASRISEKMRDFAERVTQSKTLQVAI